MLFTCQNVSFLSYHNTPNRIPFNFWCKFVLIQFKQSIVRIHSLINRWMTIHKLMSTDIHNTVQQFSFFVWFKFFFARQLFYTIAFFTVIGCSLSIELILIQQLFNFFTSRFSIFMWLSYNWARAQFIHFSLYLTIYPFSYNSHTLDFISFEKKNLFHLSTHCFWFTLFLL